MGGADGSRTPLQEMLDQEFEVRKVALGKEQDMLKIQQEALLQGGPNAQSIAANLFKELNDPGAPSPDMFTHCSSALVSL